MTTPDIQQAREWAEWAGKKLGVAESHANALAAARVIQSLPDQWVDAEKVREIYDRYRAIEITLHEAFRAAVALTTPPLPTLAELIEQGNDPGQYYWMQAEVFHTGELGCVMSADLYDESSKILFPNAVVKAVPWEDITPLPDLPKLEWPGSTPDDVAYATGGALTTQDVVDECRAVRKERALPRPEDVPAGEPWLVLSEGRRAIGYRNDSGASLPWVITYQGCMEFDYCYDSDITLVSRLVPEVKP